MTPAVVTRRPAAKGTCARKIGRKAGGKHSPTLLACRGCGVRWCWECALRGGKAFGPSLPGSGWTMFRKGDSKFLTFTCLSCQSAWAAGTMAAHAWLAAERNVARGGR